jgi:hypothetical protein
MSCVVLPTLSALPDKLALFVILIGLALVLLFCIYLKVFVQDAKHKELAYNEKRFSFEEGKTAYLATKYTKEMAWDKWHCPKCREYWEDCQCYESV